MIQNHGFIAEVTLIDLDIRRSAHEIIKQHGKDAAIHAAMKADKLLATGEVDVLTGWKNEWH